MREGNHISGIDTIKEMQTRQLPRRKVDYRLLSQVWPSLLYALNEIRLSRSIIRNTLLRVPSIAEIALWWITIIG
jgi:hypothetical protein